MIGFKFFFYLFFFQVVFFFSTCYLLLTFLFTFNSLKFLLVIQFSLSVRFHCEVCAVVGAAKVGHGATHLTDFVAYNHRANRFTHPSC